MLKITTRGHLTIRSLSAQLPEETSLFTKSRSTYVQCIMGGFTSKTKHHNSGGRNPSWQDIFTYNVSNENEITLQVIEKKMLSKDEVLGEAKIKLDQVFMNKKLEGKLPLCYRGSEIGSINVKIDWMPLENNQMYSSLPPGHMMPQQQIYVVPNKNQPVNFGPPPNQINFGLPPNQMNFRPNQNIMPAMQMPMNSGPQQNFIPSIYNPNQNLMQPNQFIYNQNPNIAQSYYPPKQMESSPNVNTDIITPNIMNSSHSQNDYNKNQNFNNPPVQKIFSENSDLIKQKYANSNIFGDPDAIQKNEIYPSLIENQFAINAGNKQNLPNFPPQEQLAYEYPKENEVVDDIEFQRRMAEQQKNYAKI